MSLTSVFSAFCDNGAGWKNYIGAVSYTHLITFSELAQAEFLYIFELAQALVTGVFKRSGAPAVDHTHGLQMLSLIHILVAEAQEAAAQGEGSFCGYRDFGDGVLKYKIGRAHV